jgi:hypothetical protein
MNYPLCVTCGTEYEVKEELPATCAICSDDRQYVGWQGQQWTTMRALAKQHKIRFKKENGLLALGLDSVFAIDQRALLLPTDFGNVLWECVSLVTDEAVAELRRYGGVACIAISHPHFYSSMIEWSEALGGVPIFLHEADRHWVMRSSSHIVFWSGERHKFSNEVTLLRLGGHFEGSSGLHWKGGPFPDGALFPGDAIQVTMDRKHASFMYSYPNAIPMKRSDVVTLRERVSDLDYDTVFGFTWDRDIVGDAKSAVEQSLDRYFAAVDG